MDKFSKGEWSSEAALSSDNHNIRYVTADGKRIASVSHQIGMEQDEALANAALLSNAKNMLIALDTIARDLKGLPQVNIGNGRAQYLATLAQNVVNKARSVDGRRPSLILEQRCELTGEISNFGVRVIRNGDAYGLDDCLLWDKDEPGIEFYLLADRHGRIYPGRGWFVSRYYYTTLKFRQGSQEGLCLDGGNYETCTLSGEEFAQAMEIVDAKIATFADASVIEQWRKSWHIGRKET